MQAMMLKALSNPKAKAVVIDMRTGKSKDIPAQRTGQICGTACPPGVKNGREMAAALNRGIPGQDGYCQYSVLPLSGSILAGATTTLTDPASPIALCVESIVVVDPDGSGFDLANLTIGNRPQWIIDGLYNNLLFAPDSECSCCLPADCIDIGSRVSVDVTNLDAQDPHTVYLFLRGPAIY